MSRWTLTGGKLVVSEWPSAGYQFPDRQWGADDRSTRFRVTYQAGNCTGPADVQRAAIVTIRDVLAPRPAVPAPPGPPAVPPLAIPTPRPSSAAAIVGP